MFSKSLQQYSQHFFVSLEFLCERGIGHGVGKLVAHNFSGKSGDTQTLNTPILVAARAAAIAVDQGIARNGGQPFGYGAVAGERGSALMKLPIDLPPLAVIAQSETGADF